MFLVDREKTGRSPFTLGNLSVPERVWETSLRQHPLKGPESTAVIDADGNLYFGCHDNCIYSLNAQGAVRWQFVTEDKVYASPVLLNNNLFFCCNKADVISLDLDGNLRWSFNGFRELSKLSRAKRLIANYRSYLRYDYEFKKYGKINAWGSPNVLIDNSIVVNLYGLGVVALDPESGTLIWRSDLGTPYYHLAGVAITLADGKELIVAVSQSGNVVGMDKRGKVLWKRSLQRGFNSWGNPSIDPEGRSIYCTTSQGNTAAYIYKFDLAGNAIWSQKIDAGIRGTVSISKENYVLVPTMKGDLLFKDKTNGSTLQIKSIATRERGLWTSATIDQRGDILINTKAGSYAGSLMRLSKEGVVKWEVKYGKALAVPVLDTAGNIYTATWEGKYIKYRS